MFEKIILNSLFQYLDDNNLLNNNQSGFRPGNLRAHQLLAITNNIYKVLDTNPTLEVRGVFLDLSKAFSILGPLLFLVYINDLSKGLSSNVKLFAEDISRFLIPVLQSKPKKL